MRRARARVCACVCVSCIRWYSVLCSRIKRQRHCQRGNVWIKMDSLVPSPVDTLCVHSFLTKIKTWFELIPASIAQRVLRLRITQNIFFIWEFCWIAACRRLHSADCTLTDMESGYLWSFLWACETISRMRLESVHSQVKRTCFSSCQLHSFVSSALYERMHWPIIGRNVYSSVGNDIETEHPNGMDPHECIACNKNVQLELKRFSSAVRQPKNVIKIESARPAFRAMVI